MKIQPILTRFLAEEADATLGLTLETGFDHLPHKPSLLYNVRKGTAMNPLVRINEHCARLSGAAFDPRTLRNALGFISLHVGVSSGIVSIADPREAHRREVQQECTANYLQLVATSTDRVDDYRAAIKAGLAEQDALDISNAAMLARVAQLEGLMRVGRGRLGGAA